MLISGMRTSGLELLTIMTWSSWRSLVCVCGPSVVPDAARMNDLEAETFRACGLTIIVRHQSAHAQLFHRRQVKTVQGSTVRPWNSALLAKRGLKHRAGHRRETERV